MERNNFTWMPIKQKYWVRSCDFANQIIWLPIMNFRHMFMTMTRMAGLISWTIEVQELLFDITYKVFVNYPSHRNYSTAWERYFISDHDELKDWITYAEKRDCISYSAIILKKITSKNRKVVELCLNSMVMRAFSLKGNYQIFGE